MVDDGFDQVKISCVEILEIPPGNLCRRDILCAACLNHLVGKVGKPAAFVLVFPEAAGREEKIEMGKLVEKERLLLENETCFQEGHVKAFPVVGDNGLEVHLGKKLVKLLNHPLFFGKFAKEVLRDVEFVISVIAHTDKERNDPRSSGKPCGFQVEEEGCGEVKGLEGAVLA